MSDYTSNMDQTPLTEQDWRDLRAEGKYRRNEHDDGLWTRQGLEYCRHRKERGSWARDADGWGVPLHPIPFIEPGQAVPFRSAYHFPCPGIGKMEVCLGHGQGYHAPFLHCRLPCEACYIAGLRIQVTDALLLAMLPPEEAPSPVVSPISAWERVGIPKRYWGYTLDQSGVRLVRGADGQPVPLPAQKPDRVNEGKIYILEQGAADAVKHLRAWTGKDGSSTLIYGSVGNGKTTMAYAWGMDAQRSNSAFPWVLSEKAIRSGLQASFGSAPYAEAKEVMSKATKCGVLIWDDFAFTPTGNGQLPERLLAEFSAVISERYDNQRPILFTTNTTQAGLEMRLGPSLFRRVWAMCAHRFEFTGASW